MDNINDLVTQMGPLTTMVGFFMVEGVIITLLSLALMGIKLDLKKVVLIGVLHGFFVYLVRGIYTLYGIPFGTHTIILLLIHIALIKYIGKAYWGEAIAGAFLSFTILFIDETLFFTPIYQIAGLDFVNVVKDPILSVVMGNIIGLPMYIVALLVYKFNLKLFDLRN
jgi:hypothetical protein